MDAKVKEFMDKVIAKNPGEAPFHQAVQEVVESLMPFIEANPKYKEAKILERMCEPERVIIFRVPWIDDKGEFQINRGFRVQMNSAIGPYKGGIRLHPSVNLGLLKFLAFEQVLKIVIPVTSPVNVMLYLVLFLCAVSVAAFFKVIAPL